MWKHIIFFQKIFQSCRPFQIKYSKEQGFYQNSSPMQNTVSRFFDFNMFILGICGLVGFKRFLSEQPDQNDRQAVKRYVLGGVLQLLFMGCNFAMIPACITLRNHCPENIWLLNQGLNFSIKRKLSPVAPQTKTLLNASFQFTVLTWSTVVAVAFGAFTMTLTAIVFDATPAHVLLSFFIDTTERSWKITVFCLMYMGTIYFFGGFITCSSVIVSMCAVHYETPFLLNKIEEYSKRHYSFDLEQKRHKTAYIFISVFNQFGVSFFPLLCTAGFLINVAMTVAVIKYHSSLSSILLLIFISFDVSVIVVTIGLHTFSCISLEASAAFREYWRYKIKGKLERRLLWSCKPIYVNIGPFFMLSRTVVMRTFDQILNQTVNVLIMDS